MVEGERGVRFSRSREVPFNWAKREKDRTTLEHGPNTEHLKPPYRTPYVKRK